MSHELTARENGTYEFAFAGSRSEIWHGLGQELTAGAGLDVWRKEAGMDWNINTSDLTFTDDGTVHNYDSKRVLYRSDSKKPLAIVGSGYKVVQPNEVMEFFRSLVEDAGMTLSAAGTIYGGRKFWATADTGNSVLLNNRKDLMNGYILLATSCDGTMATTATFTSCRTVCNNTLNIALSGASDSKTRVTSSHRSVFKPNDIKGKLGLFESSWDKFAKTMEAMTKIKLTPKDAYSCIMQIVCDDASDPTATELKIVNTVEDLYKGGGMGADLAGKTAYGLLNAVTEFYDYNVGRVPSNKLNSSFWGQASKSKTAALEFLTNRYDITV